MRRVMGMLFLSVEHQRIATAFMINNNIDSVEYLEKHYRFFIEDDKLIITHSFVCV